MDIWYHPPVIVTRQVTERNRSSGTSAINHVYHYLNPDGIFYRLYLHGDLNDAQEYSVEALS